MTAIAPAAPAGRKWAAWLLLLVLLLAAGMVPDLVPLPEPDAGYSIATADFEGGAGESGAVSLPHLWNGASGSEPATATYRMRFESRQLPSKPVSLFIPATRHNVEVSINGEPALSDLDTAWTSPINGYSYIARVPEAAIRDGANEITIRQTREAGRLPGYLSAVYLGPHSALAPHYRVRSFIIEQLRMMTLALHVVIAIGIVSLWTTRRHDPVFRWLALIAVGSLFVALSQSPLTVPYGRPFQIHFTVVMPAVGLMALGLALAIAGRRPPRLLVPAIIAVPLILLAVAFTRILPLPLVALSSASLALTAYAASSCILAADFAERRNTDAALLAVPFALTVWFGLHDVLLVVGLDDDAFMRVPYGRLLILIAVMVILLTRLARSLNELDGANETLRQRLAAQEAELVLLHEKERARTGELVREHERERLMRDLHDGLSGHLASIIALSENPETDRRAIEMSAREALDDLRLVIHSLDIGDRDLLVALAGFRERLGPQLRRLGVTLEWSTDAMPEVAGVTPGNALAILRILQEAVTNALKHGPATRVAIRGVPERGGARILVENDGNTATPRGQGRGLSNMRRRARAIGGAVTLDVNETGASLALHLPARLPETAV